MRSYHFVTELTYKWMFLFFPSVEIRISYSDKLNLHPPLTTSQRKSLSYKNQSIDLLDWFLYDRDLRHELIFLRITDLLLFNSFMSLLSFCTFWKLGETKVFLVFSRSIESDQWHKIGQVIGLLFSSSEP